MTLLGALGDIHGDFASARRVMNRHPEVVFWLCVGDIADAEGRYEPLPAQLFWIKGNNDNFDLLDGTRPAPYDYIPNGRFVDVPIGSGTSNPVRIAGLGGTYAPTMYEYPAKDLPHPKKSSPKATEQADRRRHFVREEVNGCRAMTGVDIFLSHEAPRPFRVYRGIDAGKTPINEILTDMQPRLHLFGHHHRFAAARVSGVPSLCLDAIAGSYLLIDAKTLEYQHLPS